MTGGLGSVSRGLYNAWRQIWESSAVLDAQPVLAKAKIRFAKTVATLAFEYGTLKGKARLSRQDLSVTATKEVPVTVPPNATNEEEHLSESKVAVVIPALVTNKKHSENLHRVIDCVYQQSMTPSLVIVVDDGSPVAQASILRHSFPHLTIIRSEKNEGPAAARNKGFKAARRAKMDFVCFTDADCLPEKTWVENTLKHFEQHPLDDIIGGITRSFNGKNYVELFHDAFGTLNGRLLPDGTLLYAASCNMGVRLNTVAVEFNPVFSEAAFEDIDFCINARKAGAILKSDESVRVVHDYDASMEGLIKQFTRYGRSSSLMQKLHPYYHSWLATTQSVPVKKFSHDDGSDSSCSLLENRGWT